MTPTGVTVLWNPSAGSARPGLEAQVVALFRAAGCEAEMVALQKGQDPARAARAASAGAEIVVAAGGDGTVSRVAAGVIGTPAALGVLPIGTLNHFAKDLHIPLDVDAAVATIAARHIGHVDVGQVNDRLFVNNSSIGIYPSIVDVREELRRQGHRKWPAMALATISVLRRYRGMRVNIEVDGREFVWRTPFVFVGNNDYAVEGIRLGARTRLDEGRLYAYVAPRVRTRELPILLAKALLGRVRHSGEFAILSAAELRVSVAGGRHIRVAFDGEIGRLAAPLQYRSCPGALRVVVPHS
jgi:diacylglycerol kinase family enzyme